MCCCRCCCVCCVEEQILKLQRVKHRCSQIFPSVGTRHLHPRCYLWTLCHAFGFFSCFSCVYIHRGVWTKKFITVYVIMLFKANASHFSTIFNTRRPFPALVTGWLFRARHWLVGCLFFPLAFLYLARAFYRLPGFHLRRKHRRKHKYKHKSFMSSEKRTRRKHKKGNILILVLVLMFMSRLFHGEISTLWLRLCWRH